MTALYIRTRRHFDDDRPNRARNLSPLTGNYSALLTLYHFRVGVRFEEVNDLFGGDSVRQRTAHTLPSYHAWESRFEKKRLARPSDM